MNDHLNLELSDARGMRQSSIKLIREQAQKIANMTQQDPRTQKVSKRDVEDGTMLIFPDGTRQVLTVTVIED